MPVIPTTQEVETGGSKVQGRPWAKLARSCLKNKARRNSNGQKTHEKMLTIPSKKGNAN
jgi:hypothetical protein